MLARLAFLAAILASPSAALAQGTVWLVDDDGGLGVDFTRLQDAIDAAADGDTLLLAPGTYDPPPAFPPVPTQLIGKSIAIRAQTAIAPTIGDLVVSDVSGLVVLEGLDFDRPLRLQDSPGRIHLEACRIAIPNFTANGALDVDACARVTLLRCESNGAENLFPTPALRGTDSNVRALGSVFRGGDGYGSSTQGAAGARIVGGTLDAWSCAFTGGDGGCGGQGLHLATGAPRVRSHGSAFTAGAAQACADEPLAAVQVDTGSHEVIARALRSR